MATNSPAKLLKTVHEDDRASDWSISLETRDDPLALARVLEKLAVPAVELRAVHYVREEQRGTVLLRVKGSEAWLRLLVRKLGKLVAVRNVRLKAVTAIGTA